MFSIKLSIASMTFCVDIEKRHQEKLELGEFRFYFPSRQRDLLIQAALVFCRPVQPLPHCYALAISWWIYTMLQHKAQVVITQSWTAYLELIPGFTFLFEINKHWRINVGVMDARLLSVQFFSFSFSFEEKLTFAVGALCLGNPPLMRVLAANDLFLVRHSECEFESETFLWCLPSVSVIITLNLLRTDLLAMSISQ